MVSLVAKKDLRYASKDMRAGDTFDASEKDAQILKAVGHAEESPAAGDETTEDVLQKQRKPRTYRRRDLLAEGSEGDE